MGEKETLTLKSRQHPPQTQDLPFDLHHLVGGAGSYLQNPRQNTSYPSPQMEHEAYGQQHFGTIHYPDPQQSMGLGIQYHGYEHPAQGYYVPDGRHSHSGSPFMQPAMPMSAPGTPRSVHSDIGRRTRSGRSAARTDSPHGSVRKRTPPRTKKQKGGKEKTKTPKLTAPLSVLTKDMTNVIVRDMEKWVNRSAEDRRKEAEKRNGYVTRPMNSFMLYRSAYAERTKAWCVHNNHQVVSSVSGESWPLEPQEVREFYNELARIERVNHQNAHPDYKFSPSKPGAAARKRKGTESEDESEPSDLDDPEADWAPHTHRGARSKAVRRPGRDAGYPARANINLSQDPYDANFGPGDVVYNKSSWEANNGGRPLPAQMGHQNLYGHQYYQTSIHQNPHMMAGVEDIRYAPMEAPGFGSNQSLIGLPGGSHQDLLGMHSGTPTPMIEPQVDPMLLAFDSQHAASVGMVADLSLGQHPQFHGLAFGSEFDQYTTAPGPLVTDYQTKQWEPESTSPTFEHPGEFEKLWAEHDAQLMERRQSAKSTGSAKQAGNVDKNEPQPSETE